MSGSDLLGAGTMGPNCLAGLLSDVIRHRNETKTQESVRGDSMFLGLRTALYKVDDLEVAKEWYSKVLGIEPYFDEPFYVGYSVGGFELGLDPDMSGVTRGNHHVAYWGVENAESAVERLAELNVEAHESLTEVGQGIKVATFKDPFGNIFGLIENPHFGS